MMIVWLSSKAESLVWNPISQMQRLSGEEDQGKQKGDATLCNIIQSGRGGEEGRSPGPGTAFLPPQNVRK